MVSEKNQMGVVIKKIDLETSEILSQETFLLDQQYVEAQLNKGLSSSGTQNYVISFSRIIRESNQNIKSELIGLYKYLKENIPTPEDTYKMIADLYFIYSDGMEPSYTSDAIVGLSYRVGHSEDLASQLSDYISTETLDLTI